MIDIHTDKIKLVIWDLDDTFWQGTLSENGGVRLVKNNIEMVRKLTDRGIINSISSKNDFESAKAKLIEADIWEYFVFPCINWDSKGQQIKEILDWCSLRPQNALFLDDNIQNLNEAKFYNSQINIATPDILDNLLNRSELKGNEDYQHDRLRQYKVLEKKHIALEAYDDNSEFLRASNIRVSIKNDCLNHTDRILDLINRSNQLNYTKKRLTAEELKALLKDPSVNAGYVEVFDNFGEYGIVGFFAIRGDRAEHFLFSCRTIGMGVEQYVFAELGYPKIDVVGEVRYELKQTFMPDWINTGSSLKTEKAEQDFNRTARLQKRILISGGCDLEQMAAYLRAKQLKIDYSFNIGLARHDHTIYYKEIIELSAKEKKELMDRLPIIGPSTFDTPLFSNKYDVVVLSLLMDYTQALYEDKQKHYLVAYGDFNKSITSYRPDGFTDTQYHDLVHNFYCHGGESPEELLNNLRLIRERIPKETKLVLINGCEVPLDHEYEIDRYKRHKEMNAVVDQFVGENTRNTYLFDIRKIVTRREQLTDNIRHYDRKTYFIMAQEFVRLINTIYGTEDLLDTEDSRKQERKVMWRRRLRRLRGLWDKYL